MFRNFKILFVVFVVIAIAGSAYAFAAAITVPTAKAGEGVGVVSTYIVTSVVYTYNATDPSKIDSVAFTTDSLAASVKIKLVTAGNDWYTCDDGITLGVDWTCDTDSDPGPQATVALTTGLTIVAIGQ